MRRYSSPLVAYERRGVHCRSGNAVDAINYKKALLRSVSSQLRGIEAVRQCPPHRGVTIDSYSTVGCLAGISPIVDDFAIEEATDVKIDARSEVEESTSEVSVYDTELYPQGPRDLLVSVEKGPAVLKDGTTTSASRMTMQLPFIFPQKGPPFRLEQLIRRDFALLSRLQQSGHLKLYDSLIDSFKKAGYIRPVAVSDVKADDSGIVSPRSQFIQERFVLCDCARFVHICFVHADLERKWKKRINPADGPTRARLIPDLLEERRQYFEALLLQPFRPLCFWNTAYISTSFAEAPEDVLKKFFHVGDDGIILHTIEAPEERPIFVPSALAEEVAEAVRVCAKHPGRDRTRQLVGRYSWCKGLYKLVNRIVCS
ncbi:hypothetical protein FOL47_003451 [Perkinsus chesapeaki]|uniref:Uncharacterized protein n=1 Tax=Perkinsus chesapeaki TaxID=330153 RepID=A0A7J6M7R1_PERCH|nr:hypothetical protein FOL47_003451 [Perkinsus chesapeaki]